MYKFSFLLVAFLTIAGCQKDASTMLNPLPSFNDGDSKSEIVQYVKRVTNSNSPDYIPPEDRIVCFDNDGTLWVEQPLPNQVYFAFDQVLALMDNSPNLRGELPYQSLYEGDVQSLIKEGPKAIVSIVGKADQILNDRYDVAVNDWIDNSIHPVLERPYKNTVYQPMLEVMDYLKANDFKIYIVSSGGAKFMRAWQPRVYGLQSANIIGSTFKTDTIRAGDSVAVVSTPELDFLDDNEGKVVGINKYIGKKPVMIFGNSDGDLEMMEYATTDNPYSTLMVYINHTDGEREFYYDDLTLSGRLEKGLITAQRKGWTVVDMKKDWKTVFVE